MPSVTLFTSPHLTCMAGVKNLLAGEQQAAVTVAVEALMDNKPEAENFAVLDPKVTIEPAMHAVFVIGLGQGDSLRQGQFWRP